MEGRRLVSSPVQRVLKGFCSLFFKIGLVPSDFADHSIVGIIMYMYMYNTWGKVEHCLGNNRDSGVYTHMYGILGYPFATPHHRTGSAVVTSECKSALLSASDIHGPFFYGFVHVIPLHNSTHHTLYLHNIIHDLHHGRYPGMWIDMHCHD